MENGLAIVQYTDDTIFLLEDDLEGARNLKFNLCLFEQMSGLKINFRKSEIFCLGNAIHKQDFYSEIFTCNVGSLPSKYLGNPVEGKILRNSDGRNTENKMEGKLSCWQSKLISKVGGLFSSILV